jgi:hypothetical protein
MKKTSLSQTCPPGLGNASFFKNGLKLENLSSLYSGHFETTLLLSFLTAAGPFIQKVGIFFNNLEYFTTILYIL